MFFFLGFFFFFFFPSFFLRGSFGDEERKPRKLGVVVFAPSPAVLGASVLFSYFVRFEEALLSDGVVVDSLPTKSVPSEQQLLLFDEAILALLLLLLGFVTISFAKHFTRRRRRRRDSSSSPFEIFCFFPETL